MIDEQTLRDLYVDGRMSTRQIGERLGVSKTTIIRKLKKFGLPIRPTGGCGLISRGISPPSPQLLYDLIHIQRLCYREVAEMFGVDWSAVPIWLKKHNIAATGNAWTQRNAVRGYTRPSPDIIRQQYEAGKSLRLIAADFGVSRGTISKIANEAGISLRAGGYRESLTYIADDGHIVRSSYELRVDNWLAERGVAHQYDPPTPFNDLTRADFYANGWYVEIWGIGGSKTYSKNKARKRRLYRETGTPLIEIHMSSFTTKANGRWERQISKCLTPPSGNDAQCNLL